MRDSEAVSKSRFPQGETHLPSSPLYEALNFLLVRSPLFSIEHYCKLSQDTHLGVLTKGLGSMQGNSSVESIHPMIPLALAVGSQSLLQALEQNAVSVTRTRRLSGKFLRYLIRMSTRPTPYGLFAGVALARWGLKTNLGFAQVPPLRRIRPDMDWLLHLVFNLEADPSIRKHLRFFAHPAILMRAGRFFLACGVSGKDESEPNTRISVRATNAVQRVLEMAQTPISCTEVVSELLSTAPGATSEKVETLITTLWEKGFLLTDLRPPLTSGDPAHYIAARIEKIPTARKIFCDFQDLLNMAANWETTPTKQATNEYVELVKRAGKIVKKPMPEIVFQVDMALPLSGDLLSREVSNEVVRAAETLLKITPYPLGPMHLVAYRDAFLRRFGDGREVSLTELVDPNFGLIQTEEEKRTSNGETSSSRRTLRNHTLLDLACTALRDHSQVIELTEAALLNLQTSSLSFETVPKSLDVNFYVAASSQDAVDRGDFQLVIGPNVGASSAGRNLGRFAYLFEAAGTSALECAALAEASTAPNVIWAELVYLPQKARSANVAVRPSVRKYEITLNTVPGVDWSSVIPINELVVGVRHGRFYLRWPDREAEVRICGSHMLNSLTTSGVGRFLAEIGLDGIAMLSPFDWGPAEYFPFLPRVQFGRIVFRVAQWRIDLTALSKVLRTTGSFAGFPELLHSLRERWGIPRYVYLTNRDNRLLLDLENRSHVEELQVEMKGLRGLNQIILQEVFPHFEDVWVHGQGGRVMTEFVASLVIRSPGTVRSSSDRHLGASSSTAENTEHTWAGALVQPVDRVQAPGSEWLFVKLYCSNDLQNDLILGPVRNFSELVLTRGLANNWFFLRYTDPNPHIRLRFRGSPDHLRSQLLPEVCDWAKNLMTRELCTHFSLDTYEREVERYGGIKGVTLAEDIFCADSRAAARLLYLAQHGKNRLDLSLVAVVSSDDLLASLGLSEGERLELYRHISSRHDGSVEYRQNKILLRSLLTPKSHAAKATDFDEIFSVLTAHRHNLSIAGEQLRLLSESNQLSRSLAILYAAFVHTHCNRLLGIDKSIEQKVMGMLFRTREALQRHPLA